jgi:hypothetical protein
MPTPALQLKRRPERGVHHHCRGTSGCSPSRSRCTSASARGRASSGSSSTSDFCPGVDSPDYGLWRSLVSASVWGTEGRGFESRQPDTESAGHTASDWRRTRVRGCRAAETLPKSHATCEVKGEDLPRVESTPEGSNAGAVICGSDPRSMPAMTRRYPRKHAEDAPRRASAVLVVGCLGPLLGAPRSDALWLRSGVLVQASRPLVLPLGDPLGSSIPSGRLRWTRRSSAGTLRTLASAELTAISASPT